MPDFDEFDEDSPEQERWGYVRWRPQRRTQEFLDQVNEILDLYQPQRPLTLRQIYYRLVAQYHRPHNNRWYGGPLSRTLTMARRAEMRSEDGQLLVDAIRDDEFIRRDPFFYDGQPDFWYTLKRDAQEFTLDRQQGQERRIILWCEGAGMVPQLQRITAPFGIPVYSSGKFDGITCKRDLGVEWAMAQRPVTVFHLGDHNPSGIHIFESLARDVIRFACQTAERGGYDEPDIQFHRIGLLPDQVTDIDPDTPNPKDNRRFHWMALQIDADGYEDRIDINDRHSWELEALAPDTIAQIVRAAIEEHWNEEAYNAVLADEEQARRTLAQRLERAEKIMVRGN